MSTLLKLLSVVIILVWLFAGRHHEPKAETRWPAWLEEEVTAFRWIPDGLANARCSQPTLLQLEKMLRSGAFQRVIRLNGSGTKDSGGVSHAEESALCQRYGVEFIFLNAHKGYTDGKGFTQSGEEAHGLLQLGNNLIHCQHGYDRTGALVGYHLRKRGMSPAKIMAHNEWANYGQQKPGVGYEKYRETAGIEN